MMALFSTMWASIASAYSAVPFFGTFLVLLKYIIEILIIYPLRLILISFHPSKERYMDTLTSYKGYFSKVGLVFGLIKRWVCKIPKRKATPIQQQEGGDAEPKVLPSDEVIAFESAEAVLGYHLFGFIYSLDDKYRKLLLSQLFTSIHLDKIERPVYKERMANFLFDFFDAKDVIRFLMNNWFVGVMFEEYEKLRTSESGQEDGRDFQNKAFDAFFKKYKPLLKVPMGKMVYNSKAFKRRLFSNDELGGNIEKYRPYFLLSVEWGNSQKEYRRIKNLVRVGYWTVFSVKQNDLKPIHLNLIYRAYCKGQMFNDLLDLMLKGDISTNSKLDMIEGLKRYVGNIPNREEAEIFKTQLKSLVMEYGFVNQIKIDAGEIFSPKR